ncbi:MAG: hypothetical protein PHF79_01940 [Candidatus Pacebacteria bacterium]|nr:hypothetical protein [Candidatus Paceibacterota bacterium]
MLQTGIYYIRWHYGKALADVYEFSLNCLWFFYNFFSIGLLANTLFVPWQRLEEHHKGGFDLVASLEAFFVTSMMRLVGAMIRIFMIAIGLVAILGAFILSVLGFVVWLVLPIIIILFFLVGFYLIFQH